MKMKIPDSIVSDEYLETEKQNLMYKLCIRQCSTCIGYGALMIGSSKASATTAADVP
jgi:hypothetical protein